MGKVCSLTNARYTAPVQPINKDSFKYYIPAIAIGLVMNAVHIHMSTLYIHVTNMRKLENLLFLTLHH